MKIKNRINKLKDFRGTKDSLKEVTENSRTIIILGGLTVFFWMFFTLLGSPVYSYQLLTDNPLFLGEALSTLVNNQVSTGLLNVLFPVLTSFLVAAVSILTVKSLIQNYNSSGSITGTLGGIVGFAGAGCASCGAGVIALMGVTGGSAVLPFKGLGIQALAVIVLIASLEYTGRQNKICRV